MLPGSSVWIRSEPNKTRTCSAREWVHHSLAGEPSCGHSQDYPHRRPSAESFPSRLLLLFDDRGGWGRPRGIEGGLGDVRGAGGLGDATWAARVLGTAMGDPGGWVGT